MALDLSLSIQPILPKSEIARVYQPLADYLSRQTGHNIRIKAHANFLTYWSNLTRSKGFDLVLDAAHFTDYRIQKKDYEILAKLPDTVSFSIVTHEDNMVFESDELILKKVATTVSPGIGAIRLLGLFPDPMRQPKFVYADTTNEAIQMVREKAIFAAIIPSAMVPSFQDLNTVLSTQSLPHMAFSASPEIPPEDKAAIRKALLEANQTPEGKAMLAKLNFASFEPTTAEEYRGYSSLLKNVLGF
ncbi:MAG: PhnD/SsuA/transferrin family substrate-binding protein [Chloroflexi bacterium]|nr:PhnD/SsuA/transferrin family substrate-binding protein [Chloroflexota bacterium]